MRLTPRQIAAYLEFSAQIDREERADELVLAAVAAQGDTKTIETTLKELNGS
jgi:hypothetical protein